MRLLCIWLFSCVIRLNYGYVNINKNYYIKFIVYVHIFIYNINNLTKVLYKSHGISFLKSAYKIHILHKIRILINRVLEYIYIYVYIYT